MNDRLSRMPASARNRRALPVVLPKVPVVRSQADCAHSDLPATAQRDQRPVPQGAGRLDGDGPRRAAVAHAGQDGSPAGAFRWSAANGLREADPGETPLSAEEIQHAATLPRLSAEEHLKLIRSRCTEEGDCWLWNGALDGHGRPQKRHEGKTVYVRRLVRELADGMKVPSNRVVAAECGLQLCVSPDCSCIATHLQKARMAAERGVYNDIGKTMRVAMIRRAASWISDELVQQIRLAPPPASRIAAETKVSLSHVKKIRSGAARRDFSSPFAGLKS